MRISFKFISMAIAVFVIAIDLFAQPDWNVNPAEFEFTMTVTSIGLFDCMETSDENDVVAAFVNGEVRGVQAFNTEVDGRYYSFMIIYDNEFSGNEITFQLYDASENEVVEATNLLHFAENASYGSVSEPYQFNSRPNLVDILPSNDSIRGDEMAGAMIATLFTLNSRGDTVEVMYTFVDSEEGVDNDLFLLDGSDLVIKNGADPGRAMDYMIHLLAIDGSGCAADKVLELRVSEMAVGISNAETTQLDIFPNPASNFVQISSDLPLSDLRMISFDGRTLMRWTNTPPNTILNIGYIESGFYILEGWIDQKRYIGKLIVQGK